MCNHCDKLIDKTQFSEPQKKQVRKFNLDARKEGILLDMAPGDKEYGIEYIEKIDWHHSSFSSTMDSKEERFAIIYKVNNNFYLYEKFREIQPNGEYKHWTGEKAAAKVNYKQKGISDAV